MRSISDMLGGGADFGNIAVQTAARSPQAVGSSGQVNSEPLGSLTGAPPFAKLLQFLVVPYASLGVNGNQATLIAPSERANRVIVCTAPVVGFRIYVGDSGVRPGYSFELPPGLPYDVIIPGGQELYAVTNAPTYMPLQVQNSALLTGDKERRA